MWYRAVGCIVTLILSLLVTPPVAQAQQLSRVPRVGVLEERSPTALFLAAFRQGLRELGYTEGQSIVIEYRCAHGVIDQIPTLAAELLRLKVVFAYVLIGMTRPPPYSSSAPGAAVSCDLAPSRPALPKAAMSCASCRRRALTR